MISRICYTSYRLLLSRLVMKEINLKLLQAGSVSFSLTKLPADTEWENLKHPRSIDALPYTAL